MSEISTWPFPLRRDDRGHLHVPDADEHLLDLLQQLVFTARGERVDRPDFGTLVPTLVFGDAAPERLAAVRVDTLAAIGRWLGERLEVVRLEVSLAGESTVHIDIVYRRSGSDVERTARLTR